MANLDSSNVVNGNTISASDITALYDTLTGATTYDNIDIQGSSSYAESSSYALISSTATSATSATTATTAVTASNISVGLTSSGTFYPTFVASSGNKPAKASSAFTYDAANNSLTVTSSVAVTASYADTANTSNIAGVYDNGTTTLTGTFKSLAGRTPFNPGTGATSSAFPALVGKSIGTNVWITANFDTLTPEAIVITSISSSGAILFDSANGGTPANIIFTGFYI
jgi:hypothetical protein